MRDRRLAYHLLLVLTALLVSATASAQVTLADEASGVTLTLAGSWFLVEDSGGALAVNEEGCLMAIAAVPEAEAEAAVNDLDAFLGEFIENANVVEAGEDEGAFVAVGTGITEGEAVEWMIVGGAEDGWFSMIFAAATESAVTCSAEMEALLSEF